MTNMHQSERNNHRRGQVMLLATVFIVGTLATATSVAALLAILQIRQTSDIKFTAAAVGAADAAVEYALYEFFRPTSTVAAFHVTYPTGPVLQNGATLEKFCYSDAAGTVAVSCDDAAVRLIRGVGRVGNIRRAFELVLSP